MQRLALHLHAREIGLCWPDRKHEVELERPQLRHKLGAVAYPQRQVDVRVGRAVCLNHVGERVQTGSIDHADAQRATLAPRARIQPLAQLACFCEYTLRERQHLVPIGREPTLATRRLEECNAEATLQLGERLGERGLTDAQHHRRLRERLLSRRLTQVGELSNADGAKGASDVQANGWKCHAPIIALSYVFNALVLLVQCVRDPYR